MSRWLTVLLALAAVALIAASSFAVGAVVGADNEPTQPTVPPSTTTLLGETSRCGYIVRHC